MKPPPMKLLLLLALVHLVCSDPAKDALPDGERNALALRDDDPDGAAIPALAAKTNQDSAELPPGVETNTALSPDKRGFFSKLKSFFRRKGRKKGRKGKKIKYNTDDEDGSEEESHENYEKRSEDDLNPENSEADEASTEADEGTEADEASTEADEGTEADQGSEEDLAENQQYASKSRDNVKCKKCKKAEKVCRKSKRCRGSKKKCKKLKKKCKKNKKKCKKSKCQGL
ncbi:axoneme-associated protein mst101(2)-like [Homarus americanus]|uniref:Uncharacterized protein n=1 Tax=Homarus americanus TaxID=6706 RepID=A0A8J5THN1_HOMAM|nr:axoneme-associated protein mst101(2)-like [Homarus americanus]KAG7174555.1 hypothetical protein Hamer_G016460 [Homarus americanus]